MRVLLLEPQRFDVEPLRQFGELEYVFPPQAKRASVWQTEEFCADFNERLRELKFDPVNDLFAATGSIMALSVAVAEIVTEYGEFRALFYNHSTGGYTLRTLAAGMEVELKGTQTL